MGKLILPMCLLFLLCSCTEALVKNYSRPIPNQINGKSFSQSQVKKAISQACDERGWVAKHQNDGSVIATINIREHYAKVKITYSSDKLNIDFIESKGLNEKEGEFHEIHRNYHRWINNLHHSTVKILNSSELN